MNPLAAGINAVRTVRAIARSRDVDAIETPYSLGYDRLFDDVRASLESLKTAGRRCVLLTARARPQCLHARLTRLGLTAAFLRDAGVRDVVSDLDATRAVLAA